jgi:hypothetical protein
MNDKLTNRYYIALDEATSGLHDGVFTLAIAFNPHWDKDKLCKIAELAVNAIVDSKDIDTLNRIGDDLKNVGDSSET